LTTPDKIGRKKSDLRNGLNAPCKKKTKAKSKEREDGTGNPLEKGDRHATRRKAKEKGRDPAGLTGGVREDCGKVPPDTGSTG